MSRILFLSLFFAFAFAGDCVGTFTEWTACDGTCGGQSTQERWYEVQIPAVGGGAACPHENNFMESRACTVQCSSNNCEGSWGAAGACVSDGVCGSAAGKATRTYHITKPQGPGGTACPHADGFTEQLTCSAPVTPCQDCEGHFENGPCASNGVCGSPAGQRTRTYKVTKQAGPGGAACPHADGFTKQEACSAPVTPCDHCEGHFENGPCVSDGVCNSPAGKRSRTYKITKQAGPGGNACPHADGFQDQQVCSATITPCQNCQGTWSAYTTCVSNGVCGSAAGKRTRTFTVTQQAGPGGAACPHETGFVETSACAAPITPCAGCEGSWSDWGTCESDGVCSSNAGHQSRTYTVTNPGEPGGASCAAANGAKQTRACDCPTVIPCAPEACEGHFSPFSKCRATGCGSADGTQSRRFKITKQAKFGGAPCAFADGFKETRDCECPTNEIQPCPVDCKGHFEAPSECVSAGICSSDKGFFTEKYAIDVEAAHGGKACPHRNGYVKKTRCEAPITPCPPENCEGAWSTTDCKAFNCGSAAGSSVSTYSITKQARYGGVECPAKHGETRTNECECPVVVPCPVDCEGSWTENTPCVSAGKCSSAAGWTERTYVISTKAAHGGKRCPHKDGTVDRDACNTAPITPCPPVDCKGEWKRGSCKEDKCGTTDGSAQEIFKVSVKAAHGGKACEAEHNDKRIVPCSAKVIPCPVDCVGKYSEFSECKAKHECGSTAGRQFRTYHVSVAAAHGGRSCPRGDKTREWQKCEVPLVPCPPVDCVGKWSEPTPCRQKKCDERAGKNKQTYTISVPAAHGGAECPAKHGEVRHNECEVEEETMKRCPIDCKGEWTDFSPCKPTNCGCAAGLQQRQYHITQEAKYGGKHCPSAHLSVHERNCEAAKEDIERCPNALLDAPCEDLDEILKDAKAIRCKFSAIFEALKKHKDE